MSALLLSREKPLLIEQPLRELEAHLQERGRFKWVQSLQAACQQHRCSCAVEAARLGLDADAAQPTLRLSSAVLDHCPDAAAFGGRHAEALIRAHRNAEGKVQAERVLSLTPQEPHALYALSLLSYRAESLQEAARFAEQAIQAGRGNPGWLLSGLIRFRVSDFAGAKQAFQTALQTDAEDIDARFNLGLVAQKQQRYGEARAAYLAVTRLVPQHRDARHNLALLAHSIGATEEAKHHLQKLATLEPNDPRLPELRATLARPPERRSPLGD